MKKRKRWRQLCGLLLCLAMALSAIGEGSAGRSYAAQGSSVDVGSNPRPVIDIAVNVPDDYPGTFLDFKQELTQKLIDQGLDPSTFRITNTDIKIDTTNLDGWYVYDHYRDQNAYNALGLSEEQKLKQPFRQADNSHAGGPVSLKDVVANPGTKCQKFDRHIYSYQQEGKTNMLFVGYGKLALMDFMIYPATSSSKRSFSFDMDAAAVNAHTLNGAGFLLNAGLDQNGKLTGYALYFSSISGASATASIKQINNAAGNTISDLQAYGSYSVGVSLGSAKKVRIMVELTETTITVQLQQYDANNNLTGAPVTLFNGPVTLGKTGYNGFGPLVGYASHNCTGLTSYQFLDLEMSYQASAFDALKNVQYYQQAEYKYFINLVGDSNDPRIPSEYDESYADGINRMNENEIFYISNSDDGRIVTDTKVNENGETTHLGLGSQNGFYAPGDSYAETMAQFIATNYLEGNKFKQEAIRSELPLANFYILDTATGEQLMTLHKQHLVNTGETVPVNFVDRSKPGSIGNAGTEISQWCFRVYDPKNAVVYDSGWVDDPAKVKDYIFDKDSADGRWTFELLVKDNKGNESKTSQTYLTAFLDNVPPDIQGENTSKSKATITLTDRGDGIDDDGITLVKEDRGSGVMAYWVTDNVNDTPQDGDWIPVPGGPAYTSSFDIDLTEENRTIVVWAKDECGNIGSKAVFTTTLVRVEDPDGNPIDEYYVIGDQPIIVLPDPPDPDNPNEEFSSWVDGTDPVTPGTTPKPDEDKTIVIRPTYTQDKATLIYEAAGGTLGNGKDTDTFIIAAGSSLLAKIQAQKQTPVRPGYIFTGWKLQTDTGLVDVTTQTAVKDGEYHLIAQWQTCSYTLHFDANGGSLGNVKSIEVAYGTVLAPLVPTSGRGVPSRPGYLFRGWALDSAGTAIGSTTMPAKDYMVYAMWEKNNSQFVVHFDSAGGTKVSDQAYAIGTTKYQSFLNPSRSGYIFDGWFYGDDPAPATGGGSMKVSGEHTLTAHWTPKTDTKYTVDYYINTAEGYKKVNEASIVRTGVTGSTVSVQPDDIREELKAGEYSLTEDYWYNAAYSGNIFTGAITGSPTLSLKLYYDRYFDVAVTSSGEGTVNPALHQKEGSQPIISWSPAEGWHVEEVMVDGVIRDDLLLAGAYTFPEGIHGNHQVYVKFSNGLMPPKPIKPADDETPVTYKINTSLLGCTDGSCGITPTQRVEENEDVTIEWTLGEGYWVKEILVDGKPYDRQEDAKEVLFTKIHADHEVTVVVEKLPSIGGGSTSGQYTVTVNRYGGDDTVTVSGSVTVDAHDMVTTTWDAGDRYEIYKVVVDGVEKTLTNTQKGSHTLRNITANHVIDVYITEKGSTTPPDFSGDDYIEVTTQITGGPGTITGGAILKKGSDYEVDWDINTKNVSPDDPDYTYYEVDHVTVDGQVVDVQNIKLEELEKDARVEVVLKPVYEQVLIYKYGEGCVSSSRTMFKGQNYKEIEGTPALGWGISAVYINDTDESLMPSPALITADEPEETLPEEESPAEEDPGAAGPDASAGDTPGTDGFETNTPEADVPETSAPKAEMPETSVPETDVADTSMPETDVPEVNAPGIDIPETDISEENVPETNVPGTDLSEINTPEVNIPETEASEPNTPETDAANASEWETSNEASPCAALSDDFIPEHVEDQTEAAEPESDENQTEAQTPETEESRPDESQNDIPQMSVPEPDETAADESQPEGPDRNSPQNDTIQDEATGKAPSAADETASETLTAPETTVVQGRPMMTETVFAVTGTENEIHGTATYSKLEMSITNITARQKVFVIFTKLEESSDIPEAPPTLDELKKLHMIEAQIIGGPGTASGMMVDDAGSGTADWTVGDGYEVEKIVVDGQEVPINTITNNSYPFSNVSGDHKVEIYVRKGALPKDTETKKGTYHDVIHTVSTEILGETGSITPGSSVLDEGSCEVRWEIPAKDKDTNEIKYVLVDGKVRPDLLAAGQVILENVTTDHKVVVVIGKIGKLPVNVDTDGDGKPDINIDTDGDGKPDIDMDTDGDGKPDINIDTDGDNKPDINIDIDGDGKPDINIDTNGDGIADTNIVQPEEPEKPEESPSQKPEESPGQKPEESPGQKPEGPPSQKPEELPGQSPTDFVSPISTADFQTQKTGLLPTGDDTPDAEGFIALAVCAAAAMCLLLNKIRKLKKETDR